MGEVQEETPLLSFGSTNRGRRPLNTGLRLLPTTTVETSEEVKVGVKEAAAAGAKNALARNVEVGADATTKLDSLILPTRTSTWCTSSESKTLRLARTLFTRSNSLWSG